MMVQSTGPGGPGPGALTFQQLAHLAGLLPDPAHCAVPQVGPGPLVRTAQASIHDRDPIGRLAADLGDDLALVLMFVSPDADFATLVAEGAAAFGDAEVVACTTAGEIGENGYADEEIVAVGLPLVNFAVRTLLIPDLDRLDGFAAIGDVIRARMALDRMHPDLPHAFGFLLVDGLSLREDELTNAIAAGLGPVRLFGGSAGDGTRFREAFVSVNGRVHRNAAVLTFVKTACEIEVFSLDNLEPGRDRMVVTRADPSRRMVQEINAEPAAREYARILGKNPYNLDPFTFAAHPLVVRVGGRHHVRAIQRVTEDGELVFFSAIDEGIVLTLAESANLVRHLDTSLAEIGRGRRVDTIIGCDCFLRRIEAGQKQESRAISEILRRHRVFGFNTYGEQVDAKHVNQTMTGVAIFRPD